MKIVAACAWYEEPPAFLDRMVRSLEGHVDSLVALDGAWYGFPGEATSTREERDTIRVAASEAGIPTRIVTPPRTWASQVEKRQALFRLAIHEQAADWVLVVDGDVWIERCDDGALWRSLELTDLDVALVALTQMNGGWPHSELGPQERPPQRHLFRAHPKLTVDKAHNGVHVGLRWLAGDPAFVKLEPALDLSRVVHFAHDNQNRGTERDEKARAYRKTRMQEGLESWR